MKLVLVAILLVVGYFVWRFVVMGDALVVMTADAGRRVTGQLRHAGPRELVIEITGNDRENTVTEISVDREIAQRLALMPPPGFREEPLPLTESDREDAELVRFVAEFNRTKQRWTGRLVLAPDAVTELVIPAAAGTAVEGQMVFRYDAKLGMGGSIAHFYVDLAGTTAAAQPAVAIPAADHGG